VKLVQSNKEGIKILPNYYKQIEDLHYSYGSYGGHEVDLVNFNHIICLTTLTRDVKTKDFLLAQEDKKALDNYVKNEQKRRLQQKEHIHLHQPHHKHVQQLHLCWNQHPCCKQLAHIFHLSLKVGNKQLDLHNFNQGTHFYYKI